MSTIRLHQAKVKAIACPLAMRSLSACVNWRNTTPVQRLLQLISSRSSESNKEFIAVEIRNRNLKLLN
ncbi:hypothetical protein H6G91_31105 [Nostoc muscorum FACHB-395]|nr:hypothetical protein [Desmonostoc muscorum FACHB-395]